jgi:ribosome biogenesis GTPase / thiamine phosphate phosphatase
MSDELEDHFFAKERKTARKERRSAQEKDRSKYKKTDRKKWFEEHDRDMQMKMEKRNLLRGRVLSVIPQGFAVDHEGKEFICTLRGLLKKEKRQLKNVVTVGDFVLFEQITENEGAISYVEPRQSVLSRQDAMTRRSEHIIAANIDQVLITASVVNPPLKPSLIDRYIIAAKKGRMQPVVVINKIELLENPDNEEEKEIYEALLEAYRQAEIAVLPVSCKTKEGIDKLKEAMQNKASVFSGQSGSGKSSLINEVTGLNLAIGEVVDKTKKGSHTTTRAHLIPLTFGGFCIDTPGIKSFGIWDLQKEEIESFYTEICQMGKKCKFPNCSHIHEGECAVIEAVERGEISPFRYASYAQLYQTIEEERLRR